jgi:TolB-like protein
MTAAFAPGPAASLRVPDHELLHPIASGAYGEVWLARNVVGTLRAVKIVRRDQHASAESFEREFKGLQKFEPVSRSHAGLVDILTLGLLPDSAGFYYVMELADDVGQASRLPVQRASLLADAKLEASPPTGKMPAPQYSPRTLRADLKSRGALPADEVITLALKLTAALARLHEQGLVHRDVKPSNILFIGGEPKLADAGLVVAVDDARSLVGTAGYIAPEGPGNPQADLYALGKVLYEAAFGKDRQEFPALPADVASRPDHARLLELNAILLKACATDRRERYQSGDQMRVDLELLQKGFSVKRRQVWQKTRWLAVRLGAAAAMVVVAWSILNRFSSSIVHRSNDELPSIAVLPFDNFSPAQTDEYLGAQVSEEIANALARLPELRVIARGSVLAFKAGKNRQEDRLRLRLTSQLEGTIRRADDRIRVNVQLIDSRGGSVRWSEVYDRPVNELFGIQTHIAEQVATALKGQLTDRERALLAPKSTKNLAAYQLFLEGQHLTAKRTVADLMEAIEHYERATRLDPNFARAYAWIAITYDILNSIGHGPAKDWVSRARQAAEKALALDDRMAEAHSAIGAIKEIYDWDYAAAEAEYRRALELDPNCMDALESYGLLLGNLGRSAEAFAQRKRLEEIDPLSASSTLALALSHWNKGEAEKAQDLFRATLERSPQWADGHRHIGEIYESKGLYAEAVVAFERYVLILGGSEQEVSELRAAFEADGMAGFWRQRLEQLDRSQKYHSWTLRAAFHARLGQTEMALACLEKAAENRERWAVQLRWNYFDGLRGHPRFQALREKMNLK